MDDEEIKEEDSEDQEDSDVAEDSEPGTGFQLVDSPEDEEPVDFDLLEDESDRLSQSLHTLEQTQQTVQTQIDQALRTLK